ncbi:MAG: RluA family pseudouridine synthase [Alphaproteobacteria bacterium]|nr:RluA family pseudouridine synthase [Alphaproteobacteria bacterium]MDD9919176.1 RluA family pseudouridine synthase [Alphaproteobacteria bacterium]
MAEPLIIPQDADGQRLDRWLLARYPQFRFGDIQKWCRTGQIRLDSKRVKGNERLKAEQKLRVPPQLAYADEKETSIPTLSATQRKNIESWILYEDDELVAINKPAGLPVQAGTGHERSADRLLLAYYEERFTPRLTHRLDKVTSGVLLFAKTRQSAEYITRQFKHREAKKTYMAIVEGAMLRPEGGQHMPPMGAITDPLLRVGNRSVIDKQEGQEAVTQYEVLDSPASGCSFMKLQPKTGRMHQLRAHLAYVGVPIVGDDAYGWAGELLEEWQGLGKNIMLHAAELTVTHPTTNESITFTAPLPAYFKV